MRLQQEANKKISELADRAHNEAITWVPRDPFSITLHHSWKLHSDANISSFRDRNLDETTRSVYKENVRISEALVIHMQEADKLRAMKDRLEKDLEEMSGEKDLNEMLVKEKVQESKHQKRMIKEVREVKVTVH